jgi:ammonia channel protein AmtB
MGLMYIQCVNSSHSYSIISSISARLQLVILFKVTQGYTILFLQTSQILGLYQSNLYHGISYTSNYSRSSTTQQQHIFCMYNVAIIGK